MSGSNDIFNSLLIFNGKNYNRWYKQMKSLFDFQEIFEVVTNGVPDLTHNAIEAHRTTHRTWWKKNCKTAFYIQYVVDNANFNRISHVESAKEVWDIFSNIM